MFRYRLFKVRDDLIYYVASGKMKESSFTFRFFYQFVTNFLRQHDNLDIVQVLKENKNNDQADLISERAVKRVMKEIDRDPEIAQTIEELYNALIDMLFWNCSALKVIRYIATYWILRRMLSAFKKHINGRCYEIWEEYQKLKFIQDEFKEIAAEPNTYAI